MHHVYLALGSNIGRRLKNLQTAIMSLEPLVHVLDCSPVYETPPWGIEDQPRFLNQVIEVETNQSPGELLIYLKAIEQKAGRVTTIRYGPRLIDLDILFYDDQVIDSPPLVIPHPRIPERAFVLKPLADIAPDFRHPVLGETVEHLLSKVDVKGIEIFSTAACDGDIG